MTYTREQWRRVRWWQQNYKSWVRTKWWKNNNIGPGPYDYDYDNEYFGYSNRNAMDQAFIQAADAAEAQWAAWEHGNIQRRRWRNAYRKARRR